MLHTYRYQISIVSLPTPPPLILKYYPQIITKYPQIITNKLNCNNLLPGVIGQSAPMFDIWGDTVNIASRMMTTGVNGKIQVGTAFCGSKRFIGLSFYVLGYKLGFKLTYSFN